MTRAIGILIFLMASSQAKCALYFEKDTTDIQVIVVKGSQDELKRNQGQALYHTSAMDKLRLEDGVLVTQGNGKMLSSLRINGSSAAQTAVVWNDLKLNNALNGQVDLMLMPSKVMHLDVVNLGSSYFGANSMSGALILQQASFDSALIVDLNYGSFENKNFTLFKSLGSVNNHHRISFSGHHSVNDYSYTSLRTGINERKLMNARARMLHLLYGNEIKLSKRWQFQSNFWFLSSNRQMPSTAVSINDSSYQLDESWRGRIGLIYNYKKWKLRFNNALSIDNLNYVNPSSDLNVIYKTIQQTNRAIVEYNLTEKVTFKGSYFYENQYSQIGIIKQLTNHGGTAKVNISQRGYLFSASSSFNQYSLGYNAFNHNVTMFKKVRLWQFGLLYGTSFRPPTLNDLYWPVGGNESLLPEKGIRYQASVKRFVFRSSKGYVKFDAVINAMNFTDLIVWRPSSNPIIWEPTNVNQTYHFNQRIKVSGLWILSKMEHRITLNYNHLDVNMKGFVQATSQMIFTPEHYGSAVLSSTFNQNSIQVESQYQGESFINEANTASIPSFLLFNAKYYRTLFNEKLRFYFALNNISNQSYEIVYRRPLPRRNYSLGLTLKL